MHNNTQRKECTEDYALNFIFGSRLLSFPCVFTSYNEVICPEWFEASAIAYTFLILGSRLARALIQEHPSCTPAHLCCTSACLVHPVLFVCLLVAVAYPQDQCRTLDSAAVYSCRCRTIPAARFAPFFIYSKLHNIIYRHRDTPLQKQYANSCAARGLHRFSQGVHAGVALLVRQCECTF